MRGIWLLAIYLSSKPNDRWDDLMQRSSGLQETGRIALIGRAILGNLKFRQPVMVAILTKPCESLGLHNLLSPAVGRKAIRVDGAYYFGGA